MSIAIENLVHGDEAWKRSKFCMLVGDSLVGIADLKAVYPKRRYSVFEAAIARPKGSTWSEYEVVKEGLWWTPWRPVSCVFMNEFGQVPLLVVFKETPTYFAHFDVRFHLDLAKKSASWNGYFISETFRENLWFQKIIRPHSWGQLWISNLEFWQDQRHRICRQSYGKDDISCSHWSDNIRGNFPIMNSTVCKWFIGLSRIDPTTCGKASMSIPLNGAVISPGDKPIADLGAPSTNCS